MSEQVYPVYYHVSDVQALREMLTREGIKVFAIDKRKHPRAFKSTSLKFVVDSTVEELRAALTRRDITWKPSARHAEQGFVQCIGPKRGSTVNIDVLSHVSDDLTRDIFTGFKEGWAPHLLESLQDSGLLKVLFPELADTVDLDGGPYHAETVFQHLMNALRHSREYPPILQLAVLLHDIGKPATCATKKGKDGKVASTFHNHEVVGASIAFNICKRMRLHTDDTHYVTKMVRHHMFRFQDDSTDKAIKKWLFLVGRDEWEDLFLLRISDRKGNMAKQGRPPVTQKMKELRTKIEDLTASSEAIFKEDIPLSELEIEELLDKPDQLQEVYLSVISLVNHDPGKNNREWLTQYIKRVFGLKQDDDDDNIQTA